VSRLSTGECTHRRTYYAEAVIAKVVEGLREQLTDTRSISAFLDEYRAERARLAKSQTLSASRIKKELREVVSRIGRLVAALADGGEEIASVRSALLDLERQKKELEAKLENIEAAARVISIHPGAVSRCLELIKTFTAGEMLASGSGRTAEVIRQLVECVIVFDAPKPQINIEVRGILWPIVGENGSSAKPLDAITPAFHFKKSA
jgi:hypothetical protein